jgi:hypothetical protein
MNMVIGILSILAGFAALCAMVVGLIRPALFKRKTGEVPSRKKIIKAGLLTYGATFIIMVIAVATDGPKSKQAAPTVAAATPAPDTRKVAAATVKPSEEELKKKSEAEVAECKKNPDCAFKKFDIEARSMCEMSVERVAEERASYQVKFDDSMFSHPFFDKTGFKSGKIKGTHSLAYSGNRALFQNGFGAFKRTRYYCSYNLDIMQVEHVEFVES